MHSLDLQPPAGSLYVHVNAARVPHRRQGAGASSDQQSAACCTCHTKSRLPAYLSTVTSWRAMRSEPNAASSTCGKAPEASSRQLDAGMRVPQHPGQQAELTASQRANNSMCATTCSLPRNAERLAHLQAVPAEVGVEVLRKHVRQPPSVGVPAQPQGQRE